MTLRDKIKKVFFLPITKYYYTLKGIGTYLPGFLACLFPKHQNQFYNRGSIRQGLITARNWYTLWLRHLVVLSEGKVDIKSIKTVGEFGAGDSLGIGLAALLSGVNKYYAIDISENAYTSDNLKILDELIDLFKNKTSIPDNNEFPKVKPDLNSYDFPSHILTDECLKENLAEERLEKIRQAVLNVINKKPADLENEISINYVSSKQEFIGIKEGFFDFIYSVAVMEHVDDIDEAYSYFAKWLKKGGVMAHTVGYNSHETARLWNGHWTYSDYLWKIIRGRCHYLINRHAHSQQIDCLKKNNFEMILDHRYSAKNILRKSDLAKRFKNINQEDLSTHSGFILARKV